MEPVDTFDPFPTVVGMRFLFLAGLHESRTGSDGGSGGGGGGRPNVGGNFKLFANFWNAFKLACFE